MLKIDLYWDEDADVSGRPELEYEKLADTVCRHALECELPQEGDNDFFVSIMLTDNDGIKAINRECRDIDDATDVLSFPNITFVIPGDLSSVSEKPVEYTDPENGEIILGDMVISIDRVVSQAKEYGHSTEREFSFLMAHSMLHLLGYDHMEPSEAEILESKQEKILGDLGITRG